MTNTVGVPMGEETNRWSRNVLALTLTLLLLFAAGCKSTSADSSSSSGGAAAAAAPTAPPSGDPQNICGTPPCVRFISRGDTKTLSSTLTDHPILSTVALHAAVAVLCGGILCLLGEGVGLAYVDHTAKDAAGRHECLKVSILPDHNEWQLVNLTASNQSPYCTD
jgi:hypothetical protein